MIGTIEVLDDIKSQKKHELLKTYELLPVGQLKSKKQTGKSSHHRFENLPDCSPERNLQEGEIETTEIELKGLEKKNSDTDDSEFEKNNESFLNEERQKKKTLQNFQSERICLNLANNEEKANIPVYKKVYGDKFTTTTIETEISNASKSVLNNFTNSQDSLEKTSIPGANSDDAKPGINEEKEKLCRLKFPPNTFDDNTLEKRFIYRTLRPQKDGEQFWEEETIDYKKPSTSAPGKEMKGESENMKGKNQDKKQKGKRKQIAKNQRIKLKKKVATLYKNESKFAQSFLAQLCRLKMQEFKTEHSNTEQQNLRKQGEANPSSDLNMNKNTHKQELSQRHSAAPHYQFNSYNRNNEYQHKEEEEEINLQFERNYSFLIESTFNFYFNLFMLRFWKGLFRYNVKYTP
jgi:hypothetical protein